MNASRINATAPIFYLRTVDTYMRALKVCERYISGYVKELKRL